MSTTIYILILEFFIFSCLGWLMEVILKYIQFRRFINRGFLIGPYCPIYGWGVVTVTILVGGFFMRHGSVWETFLAGFVICGAMEYFASWYMEKLFHARWWDYSQKPMNLNGRVWIGNLILFGLGSVVIVHIIDPWFFETAGKIQPGTLKILAVMIAVVIAVDYAVSNFLMGIVKKTIDAQSGDSTEEISIQVHEMLKDRNILIRRIHQAYPDLQARPEAMMKEWKAAKERFRQARKDTRKVMRDLRTAQKDRLTFDEEKWKKAVAKVRQDQRRFEEELGKVREKFERRIRY